MFELKPLSRNAIPAALEKAHRYRLLNEPAEAESICRDVLDIEPDNQDALVSLFLALTDQFEDWRVSVIEPAREILSRIQDEYTRVYHTGILYERQAKAHIKRGGPRAGHSAYGCLRQAMEHFEQAAALRPPANDDAILRWNTCARLLMGDPKLVPEPDEVVHTWLE
jgi:tetratricopeptide (TPR) repeat protein